MRLFICLSTFLFSSQICVSQKHASLIIKSDQNSLEFINSIYFLKGDRSLHTWMFDIKNISLSDLELGHYKIKYITCFLDTLVEDIHIDEYQKYRITYPDNNFYSPAGSVDPIIEKFLIDDEGILKVYIKSNIYDHTFYHQVLIIMKNQNQYRGYYACHNYGPDINEGLHDTITNPDISINYVKELIEFIFENQNATNPNAFVSCNHFSEIYVMMNKQYFYFNLCEDELEKTFNLIDEF